VYIPPHFRQDELAQLHAQIRSTRLATLVTVVHNAPLVSHVPMILDDAVNSPYGMLLCHVSRANPQWQSVNGETEALAIFLGPDAYVSPSWYAAKREHGKVVPTWNYIAVHAYGMIRTFDDAVRLRALVERLTRKHEADRPDPWNVSDAPPEFIDAQLRGIVGLEIAIARLEGKWKLSQNRSPADVDGVIAALESSPEEMDRATGAAMRAAQREPS
jgi:transcriptional regulator